MKNNLNKERIVELLKSKPDEWLSTNKIAKELTIHFYKIELLLSELLNENKIEKMSTGFFIFWRIKKEDQNG